MVAICENCDVVSSLCALNSTSYIQFTLIDSAKVNRINLSDHQLLEDLLLIPVSSKIIFIKQFINMSIQVTYDKSSMIVTKIVKVPAGCHQLSKIDEDNLFGDDGDIFEE